MDRFIDWLMRDEQKALFDLLVALVLNILFLALGALLLWPLGRAALAVTLAKGYGLLLLLIFASAALLGGFQRLLRMNLYDRAAGYVLSNLAVSSLLLAAWSAFAAWAVRLAAGGAPAWLAAVLYVLGAVSGLVAFYPVTAIYSGHIYKLAGVPIVLAGYLIFSLWPAAARAVAGWLMQLL